MTFKRLSFIAIITFTFTLLTSVQAQTPRVTTVNVTAESDRVHIAAQGDVAEMRIDVASESGDIVFESGAITGQQLDWKMQDTQGERVAAGTYLVTVTFRNAAGKLRKRVEQITVEEGEKSSVKETAAPEVVQAAVTTTTPTNGGRIPKFAGTAANASSITNSIITETSGKLNIGLAGAPFSTLTVKTATRSYGLIHTDGVYKVGTWVGQGQAGNKGGWLGTMSSHPLYLFTANGGANMTLQTNGNVGIGTLNPTAKLDVAGSVKAGGSLNVAGSMAIGGSATQPAYYGGMVKAALRIQGDGTFVTCYNGVTGSSSGNCGFSITANGGGAYTINFGSGIDTQYRFFSLSGSSSIVLASYPATNAVQIAVGNATYGYAYYILVY